MIIFENAIIASVFFASTALSTTLSFYPVNVQNNSQLTILETLSSLEEATSTISDVASSSPVVASSSQVVNINYKINKYCSCVKTAISLGLNIPLVDADKLKPNTELAVGNGVLFRYKNLSHVALVTKLTTDGFWVEEGNFLKCKKSSRLVSYNDSHIIGFVK